MQLGNRVFPYPVLNKNDNLSDYKESSTFMVSFDTNEDGSPYVVDGKVSKEFYYLGQGNIIDIKQETMANDVPVCEILYQLDQPVRKDIYDYIVNN